MLHSVVEKHLALIQEGEIKSDTAEIIKIIETKQLDLGLPEARSSEGEAEPERFFDLRALMKLFVDPVGGSFVYQGIPLNPGSEFSFSTGKYTVKAVIPPQKPISFQPYWKDFEVVFPFMRAKDLPMVQQGDKQAEVAEIVKIMEKKPLELGLTKVSSGKGEAGTEKVFDLRVLMKLLVNPQGDGFIFQGVRLNPNTEFPFSTDKYTVKAIIPPPPPPSPPPPSLEKITAKVEVKNVDSELVDIIKKGDREVLPEDLKTIAEILRIVKVENSTFYNSYDGKVHKNPLLQDVTMEISLLASQEKGGYFFKGQPVKIFNSISISTSKYTISGQIIDFSDSERR
jgi:hypothetical protein